MVKQTNRRKFLRATTAAAGTTLIPYIFSSRQVQANSANDRLHLAAIGVGGQGRYIGRRASELGNVLACADVDSSNAETFVAQLDGKCDIYTDYRKILEREDIDAITCGTPDHWHTKITVEAMRAGKDVYCEKPLTLTMDESRRIMRVAKETGRVVQVGTQQRTEFKQLFLKAVAIARSGRLGERLHAQCSIDEANAGGPFPSKDVPSHLQWDMWLGQAPAVDFCPERIGFDFRWWLEYSGGQVTDWGVHHMDIALWALGGSETGVVEVEGHGVFPGLPDTVNVLEFLDGRTKIPNQNNVAKSFECQMKLANGNTIGMDSSKNEIIIEGEKGKIRVNRGGLTGKPVEDIAASPSDVQWLNEEVRKLYRGMPLKSHMANFFHCIKTREMPISDVWTHAHSVNACHMANIAMLLKRKIVFDQAEYQFVGDDEANRFISRAQRRPWHILG